MRKLKDKEIWFVTGSQHLYGQKVIEQINGHANTIVKQINRKAGLLLSFRNKGVATTASEIKRICSAADFNDRCIGMVVWMHTFSPAKMWIGGLKKLNKPLCHLHTQFNEEIPWQSIDMDYMNLHQSAHGDREFGFIMSRMRKKRKIVVGHWQSREVWKKLNVWSRVALGWHELQTLKVARIGDNMRDVAVTEGNKVSAQIRFGFEVNGYDTTDVLRNLPGPSSRAVKRLVKEYEDQYELVATLRKGGRKRNSLVEAAQIELALSAFLEKGGFKAFTDTFENLGEFKQLPGLPVQRLMDLGFGFGAEGDWKTAALLRCCKVMGQGLDGGTSFMEDYTYHFTPEKSYVLGSHMLEICPSIANQRPSCQIHPLTIGGKADPVRLVFDGKPGEAINASLVDLGNRFRLIVNKVESVAIDHDAPGLPVARVLWDAKPDFQTAATTWILAGGAHHTVYTQALTAEYMEDFADIAGIELLVIDDRTNVRDFKDKLHANEAYFHLFQRGF